MKPPSPRASRPSVKLGRLHWADAAVLAAVGLVVLLVSLPRLREFALRENEADARSLVSRLGELSAAAAPTSTLGELLARAPQLNARLDDAVWLAEGRVLRRHGYLFQLDHSQPRTRVLAWPWDHGRTGCSLYRWTAAGLERHPNSTGEWSGLDAPATRALDDADWRPLAP